MHPAGRRRLLPTLCLLGLAASAPSPAWAQAGSEDAHVVVVDSSVVEDVVNITVASYTRPGLVQSAGLYVNNSLVSNETGGLWLSYGLTGNLSFRLREQPSRVDLRIAYEFAERGNSTVVIQTIPLTLPRGPDVRPVDARIDPEGNVTVVLENFGRARARDLLVALENAAGASIGMPYLREVPALAPGARAEARFALLESIEDLVVVVESAGERRTHLVTLRSEDGTAASQLRGLELTTEFPSLEAAPGGSALYNLQLTNRGPERLVALGASGLPEAFTSAFTIQGSRVQTVQLAAGATREVALSVGVPASGNVSEGAAQRFEVWVTTGTGNASQRLASVPLTLTVTGAPRLELSGRNWFASAAPGAILEATLEVRNRGTAAAHEVELTAQAPSGWDVSFEPERLSRLGAGETEEVTLRIAAPDGTADGRYVVDVGAEGPAGTARERSFTVEVARVQASQLPWLLAAAVAGLGGIARVVFLRRR